MNVEIGAEAALFPEKEYMKGIFVAAQPARRVCSTLSLPHPELSDTFVSMQSVAQSCSPLPRSPSCWPTIKGKTCIVIFLSLWLKV